METVEHLLFLFTLPPTLVFLFPHHSLFCNGIILTGSTYFYLQYHPVNIEMIFNIFLVFVA